MFRHRKRLISKRMNHLMKMRMRKSQSIIQKMVKQYYKTHAGDFNYPNPQFQTTQQEYQDEEFMPDQMKLADYIASLSPQQKKQFKKDNPDLPQTFYMTKKEKEKYFKQKNDNFIKSLQNQKQRHSKTKNIVKFSQIFDVKGFSQNQKVTSISKAKSFTDQYDNTIHFS